MAQSKTNQAGDRDDWRILVNGFARAIVALRTHDGEPESGPVLRVSDGQVARRLAAMGRAAGIEGSSGHSGRRGLATDLIRRGESTTAVQQAGGWRSASMVARYANSVGIESGAVVRQYGGGTADERA